MARPIEFECLVESDDPKAEYARLLSAAPSAAALQTLKDSEELDDARLQLGSEEAPASPRR